VKRYRTVIKYVQLILFAFYFSSITFFPHTHIVDGVKIVHSHPYRSGQGDHPAEHRHSNKEIILIHSIQKILLLVPMYVTIVRIFRNSFRYIRPFEKLSFFISPEKHLTYLPRAPGI